jgi:hypothetical protein
MKELILYLLLCVSALAADTGVQLASTVTTTNRIGRVTKETFTRGGQTNLVRWTMVEGGFVSLVHEFYHHSNLVAIVAGTPDPVSFDPMPGLPYQLIFNFEPSKDARCLHIHGVGFHELYYATNGFFYPAPDSDLGIEDGKKVDDKLAAKSEVVLRAKLIGYYGDDEHLRLRVQVLLVLKNESGVNFSKVLAVDSSGSKDGVPIGGKFTLYLDRYSKTNTELWGSLGRVTTQNDAA